MKRIMIIGAGSYIGTSVEKYLCESFPAEYEVDTVDVTTSAWREKSFAGYDVVYHVAGIAHSDSGKISPAKEEEYRRVNTVLTVETARKAKAEGVRQFIFMSSAIVYGKSGRIGRKKVITQTTAPRPANCYGESKLQAERGILPLCDERFRVCILRPPMVYGKGSKGNFPLLEKFARKTNVFPYVQNERSVLYIGNLVEFVRLMIDNEEQGVFWPQNAEYANTSELVGMIGAANGRKIRLIKGFGFLLKFLGFFIGAICKAFGNLTYEVGMSEYKTEYRRYSLTDSIKETEGL